MQATKLKKTVTKDNENKNNNCLMHGSFFVLII